MEIQFENKVVLITGATRGIGEQLAHDFERLGAALILTGTRPEEIKHLNENLGKNNRENMKYFCVDFSSEGSLLDFIHELKKYQRIDVCISNLSSCATSGSMARVSPGTIWKMSIGSYRSRNIFAPPTSIYYNRRCQRTKSSNSSAPETNYPRAIPFCEGSKSNTLQNILYEEDSHE